MKKIRQMAAAACAALATTACSADGGPPKTIGEMRALYAELETSDILWGQESPVPAGVGLLNPPWFTSDPDRVEVLVFGRYTPVSWQAAEPFTLLWAESLPKEILLRRVPKGIGSGKNSPLRKDWVMHQRLYIAAELAGIGDQMHAELTRRLGITRNGLGTTMKVRKFMHRFAPGVGADPTELMVALHSPVVEAGVLQATTGDWERMLADEVSGADPQRAGIDPTITVNGRYTVSASALWSPRETYRVANRLIRQELELLRQGEPAHDGPTNDAEFCDWMAPREGEIFQRRRFGKALKFRGVYNHTGCELWQIDGEGAVVRTYRLTGEGDRAYFATDDKSLEIRYVHIWRRARQYVSFEDRNGEPIRYGAFALTDWLTEPERGPVRLPFESPAGVLAFGETGEVQLHADGTLEGATRFGTKSGTWWLEGGALHVGMGEHSTQSWPWQEAAAHVGFDVPRESLAP